MEIVEVGQIVEPPKRRLQTKRIIDETIGEMINEMCRIDEKMSKGVILRPEEAVYHNTHIEIVIAYCTVCARMWSKKGFVTKNGMRMNDALPPGGFLGN